MPRMSVKDEARERILVIDDSVETADLLRDALHAQGCRASFAGDGQAGLDKALAEQPDLILLDLNLPRLSGMEVLERLRQNDCQSPVILMTAHGSESVAVRAFRLGVRDYLAKPFRVAELLAAATRALEEGQLRRERGRLLAQLSQANQLLTQRMQELSTLQVIGRSVASLMTQEKLLRRIIEAATYLAGAETGAVFMEDETSGELELQVFRHGKTYRSGLRTRVQDSHAEDVLRSGRPLWLSRPARHIDFTTLLRQRARSLLYVPIRLGDQAIGVLGVAYLQKNQGRSPETQNRLTALADYVAIALRNAQLYEGSQRQAQRLVTLNRIARTVTSSLNLEEVMRAVVRSVNRILRVETGSLLLRNEENDELVFRITLEGDTEKLADFRIKVGQGIVGHVVQTGQSLRVNDVSRDPRFYAGIDQAIGFHTHSVLCVPLSIPGKVIGAIEVINKIDDQSPEGRGQFTEEDESLLRAAAAFAAMAVENARLHEAMRETVATQTVRETIITLSHYVNNPLQVLLGGMQSVRTRLDDDRIADMMEHEVEKIAAVISLLQDTTSPESTVYLGSTQMFDIEDELKARLVAAGDQPLSQGG